MAEPARPPRNAGEGPPPFGRSWTVLYALVAGNLALWIALLFVLTRAFR